MAHQENVFAVKPDTRSTSKTYMVYRRTESLEAVL